MPPRAMPTTHDKVLAWLDGVKRNSSLHVQFRSRHLACPFHLVHSHNPFATATRWRPVAVSRVGCTLRLAASTKCEQSPNTKMSRTGLVSYLSHIWHSLKKHEILNPTYEHPKSKGNGKGAATHVLPLARQNQPGGHYFEDYDLSACKSHLCNTFVASDTKGPSN